VIDPTVTYATFLGGSDSGSGFEFLRQATEDSAGYLIVVGPSEALDFPVHVSLQAAPAGGIDGIVAKLTPAGDALVFATSYGGAGTDRAHQVAVTASDFPGSNACGNGPR